MNSEQPQHRPEPTGASKAKRNPGEDTGDALSEEGMSEGGIPEDGGSPSGDRPGPAPEPYESPGLTKREGRHSPYAAPPGYPAYEAPPPPDWVVAIRPDQPPATMRQGTGYAALAAGFLAAMLHGQGLGINLLLVSLPAAVAAYIAARAAGRRLRTWTVVWAAGCLALLAVPALRDASWPSFLAVLAGLSLGSLALHGGRTWYGTLFGSFGLIGAVLPGMRWAWRGARERAAGSRRQWGPVVRTGAVAAGLLVVFGALFVSADAAFADLLGKLVPETSVGDGPLRAMLFLLGLLGALAAARTAAAPWRWDRIRPTPGRARGRMEWALPLVVLNLLFALFNAVQLAVLFGGYDKVLSETGLSYAEYARQGFWQLLWATLLTLVVIGLALRWAPRGRQRDRTLVRAVLGALCVLTLVVVLSALRRMDLYVDAYGLTRLRISVAAVELWLGLVIVLIMVASIRGGSRMLPRAVAASAAVGVLAFGLISPDGLIAGQNVDRFESTGKIDLEYLQDLSADAVPALDSLGEPGRSCALRDIADDLEADAEEPWYATSWGEARARAILEDRPVLPDPDVCQQARGYGDDGDGYREAG